MLARVFSCAVIGLDGVVVEVEVDTGGGLPHMVIVGLPYSAAGQSTLDEISGGSPYGATTIAASDGSRQPSENELDLARFQGRHVAEIAVRLAA